MDALLGAAALGDIGRHFPDSDERYAGVSSILLLRQTYDLIREKGYRVSNIDATVICQAPKLSPFIEEMKLNLARELSISPEEVNIKATTEEKMGFTGRLEGISSHAVALIYKD